MFYWLHILKKGNNLKKQLRLVNVYFYIFVVKLLNMPIKNTENGKSEPMEIVFVSTYSL